MPHSHGREELDRWQERLQAARADLLFGWVFELALRPPFSRLDSSPLLALPSKLALLARPLMPVLGLAVGEELVQRLLEPAPIALLHAAKVA